MARGEYHLIGSPGGEVCVKRCNAKGGVYQNGDSSNWRQRWAWGYIGGYRSGILGRWGSQKGIPT